MSAARFDVLRTPRLLMRRWRDTDLEPFAAMGADPEVMRHFPSRLGRAESAAFVQRVEGLFETQGYGLWALEVLETGAFAGFTGLHPMPHDVPGGGGVEVGWRLARSAWHQGYATEAARAAVALAFGPLALPELWSMTAVTNTRSQAVMRRLGMTPHSVFDHPRVPVGHELRPHVVHHLGRPDVLGGRTSAPADGRRGGLRADGAVNDRWPPVSGQGADAADAARRRPGKRSAETGTERPEPTDAPRVRFRPR